jgi:hypothetical protein
MMPSSLNTSVLTAPAARARMVSACASFTASSLNGTVTLAPLPPSAMKARTASAKPSSGARRRSYCRSWPVCAANAAWISGDLLWAIGLPNTQ